MAAQRIVAGMSRKSPTAGGLAGSLGFAVSVGALVAMVVVALLSPLEAEATVGALRSGASSLPYRELLLRTGGAVAVLAAVTSLLVSSAGQARRLAAFERGLSGRCAT